MDRFFALMLHMMLNLAEPSNGLWEHRLVCVPLTQGERVQMLCIDSAVLRMWARYRFVDA